MPYVPLDRNFVPISKDAEPSLDIAPDIGRKYAGWLGWSQLLDRRRVVILAEASSGKTAEFQQAAVELCARGEAAFFATIEQLAEGGLTSSFGPAGHPTRRGDPSWHSANAAVLCGRCARE